MVMHRIANPSTGIRFPHQPPISNDSKVTIMKKILFACMAVLALSACSQTPEEKAASAKDRAERLVVIDSYNEKSLLNPTVVGKTPSGDVVSRSHIKFVCDSCNGYYHDDHYVYMVNGVTSDNYIFRSGKSRIEKVDVVWNDEPLTPEEIAERERKAQEERKRIKDIEDKEKKELARLKEKYPDQ